MIISISLWIFVIIFSLIFGLKFIDSSWDGRAYHQTSIILLGNGWNPIYDNLEDFASKFYNTTHLLHLMWVENYPKFVEIVQANIYTIFKNAEITKMTNILMMFVLCGYTYYVLSKKYFKNINNYLKILLSMAIIANPVYIAQFMTFYIDSYVYMLFMLILFSIIDIETSYKQNSISYIILTFSSICLVNVKLGGFLYLLVTFLVYFIYLFIYKKYNLLRKLSLSFVIIAIFTVLSGINPYFTNIKHDRHPFYPLAGKNKIDIMTPNTPKQFVDKPYIVSYIISTFACTDNFINSIDKKIYIKVPFKIYKKEIYALGDSDTRIAGFGVLWSGILLMSLIIALFIRYRNQYDKRLFLLIFTILFLLLLINPYSWWARYAPHLWVIPVFICLATLKTNTSNIKNIISSLILVIMLANTSIQLKRVYSTEKHFRKFIEFEMNALKISNKKFEIFSISDYSFVEHLKQNSINFTFVDENYFNEYKNEFRRIPTNIDTMYWRLRDN
ncbi:hypothetical protein J6P92_00655 [bacterium]|nr:hypothetical protein [bacterium]